MRQRKIARLSNGRGRHTKYRVIGCLLALLVVTPQWAMDTWAASDQPQSEKRELAFRGLQFHDGLFTAHLKAIPLPQVLNTLSRLSGTRVVWLGQPDPRQVSVTFSALPIAEAISKILGANNFLLVYTSPTEKARLREIWIATRPAPRQTGLSSPVEFVPTSEGGTGTESDDASTQETVPELDERAAQDLGAELTGMLESQLDTASHGEDLGSRIEAIGALGQMITQDARIRPLLEQLSTSERDPQVRMAAAEVLEKIEE